MLLHSSKSQTATRNPFTNTNSKVRMGGLLFDSTENSVTFTKIEHASYYVNFWM